ncbi:hypothetical protein ACFWY9_25730 [Amycolatopsis sp. NPDC059027]|uniref:hypothetical protein n=1 Tax=unclassified Amycolatopsis TaxID=2618356 RepID=UPI0036735532
MSRFSPEPLSDDDELREYRLTRERFSDFTPPVVLLLVLQIGLLFWRADDIPMRIIVTVLVALPLVLIAWYSLVSATHTDQDGVTVHGWFRARKTPWTRIQDIVVEPKHHRQLKSAPYFVTAMYDDTGRRIVLPNLNDRNGLDLEHETEILHRMWLSRRGVTWRSIPAVRQSHTPGRPAPKPPWRVALKVAATTLLLDIVALFAIAAVVADDGPWAGFFLEVVLPFLIVFGPATIAFFVTLYVTRARRAAKASGPPRPRTKKQR